MVLKVLVWCLVQLHSPERPTGFSTATFDTAGNKGMINLLGLYLGQLHHRENVLTMSTKRLPSLTTINNWSKPLPVALWPQTSVPPVGRSGSGSDVGPAINGSRIGTARTYTIDIDSGNRMSTRIALEADLLNYTFNIN